MFLLKSCLEAYTYRWTVAHLVQRKMPMLYDAHSTSEKDEKWFHEISTCFVRIRKMKRNFFSFTRKTFLIWSYIAPSGYDFMKEGEQFPCEIVKILLGYNLKHDHDDVVGYNFTVLGTYTFSEKVATLSENTLRLCCADEWNSVFEELIKKSSTSPLQSLI